MLVQLPVYNSSYKYTTDHGTHPLSFDLTTVTMVEECTWDKSGFAMGIDIRDPKDRPEICIVQAGGKEFYVAKNAKDLIKEVNIAKDLAKQDGKNATKN